MSRTQLKGRHPLEHHCAFWLYASGCPPSHRRPRVVPLQPFPRAAGLLTARERALIFRPGGQLEPGRPGGNSPVSHVELGAQRCLVEQGLHLDIACTSFNCGLCHRSCTIPGAKIAAVDDRSACAVASGQPHRKGCAVGSPRYARGHDHDKPPGQYHFTAKAASASATVAQLALLSAGNERGKYREGL